MMIKEQDWVDENEEGNKRTEISCTPGGASLLLEYKVLISTNQDQDQPIQCGENDRDQCGPMMIRLEKEGERPSRLGFRWEAW